MKNITLAAVVLATSLLCSVDATATEPMKALIVDGQNNHKVWPETTQMMKSYLEATRLPSGRGNPMVAYRCAIIR